jgi:diguanylate cyclase (GGDEF)-like protein
MKTISAKTFTMYYIAALSIIAGLSIVCHFILEGELHISESSAALINLSGRQRMLSQRIAGMATQYWLGIPGAREELAAATNAFEDGHNRLESASSNAGNDAENARLRSIYRRGRDGGEGLDSDSRRFIATARQIAALPPAAPAQQPLLAALLAQARAPLLKDLDRVVSVRQEAAEERLLQLQRIQWAILAVVLATLVAEAFMIFQPLVERIATYTAELLRLATTDALTGLANRRSFLDSAAAELERSRRSGRPLTLLVLDVDHFKRVNDTHGHAAGDQVLTNLSQTLIEGLRTVDVVGRIGGEEFAVLLPESSLGRAAEIAERLREAASQLRIRRGETTLAITISVGVAMVPEGAASITEALNAADAALYRAKEGGRDRVVVDMGVKTSTPEAMSLSGNMNLIATDCRPPAG